MKKGKVLKYIFITLLATTLLIATGTALIVYFFPTEKILTIITTNAEQFLKRRVTVGGINYGLGGIVLEDITIYNSLSTDEEILAVSTETSIRFSILPLLEKQFDISHIIIKNLKLNINYINGRFNLRDLFEDMKGRSGKPSISTQIAAITLKDAEITLKKSPGYLKPLEGNYIFNGSIDIIGEKEFQISDFKVNLPDNRGVLSSEDIGIFIFEDDFELLGDVKLTECFFLWIYKWKKGLHLPYTAFTGMVKRLKITKKIINGDVKGKSTLSNSKILSVNGFCNVDIPNRKVSISKLKGSIQRSNFSITEIFFTFNGFLKKINIPAINILLGDLRSILPSIPINLNGRVTGKIFRNNRTYNGSLNFKNVSYKGNVVSDINASITINNNTFRKENIPLKIYDQPVMASIASTDGNFRKLFLNLYSKEVRIKLQKDENPGAVMSGIKAPFDVTGKIVIETLRHKKYDFSNLVVNYSLSESNMLLNRINVQFRGGVIKGKGAVSLLNKTPDVYLSMSFNKIKVQNFFRRNELLKNKLFGIASGSVDFGFRIANSSDIFNSLKGKIEFNIDKGKIVDTGIQKGLGIWLSELKYKLRDLEFNKIYGNFKKVGPNLFINSFIFKAPDIRLKINGNIDNKFGGDIKIGLEFTRDFVQDIPNPALIFMQFKEYKKGKWFIIPFHAKGKNIFNEKSIKRL